MPPIDRMQGQYLDSRNAGAPDWPATGAFIPSLSDTVDLPRYSRSLFVGGAGNLKVDMMNGETVTITGVTAGTTLPIRVGRIWSTGTTATNLMVLD